MKWLKGIWGEAKQKLSVYSAVLHLKQYIKPFQITIIVLILINIAAATAGMINPLLTQKLIDNVVPKKDWHMFYIIFAAYIGIFIVSLILGTIVSYLQTLIAERMSFAIKKDMQKACSRANYRFLSAGTPESIFSVLTMM